MAAKQKLLNELAQSLLSNEITTDDVSELLDSIRPLGPRWLLYHIQQNNGIDIGADLAALIVNYTSTLTIYDIALSSSPDSQHPALTVPSTICGNLQPSQLTICFWCRPQAVGRHQSLISAHPAGDSTNECIWSFELSQQNKFMFNALHRKCESVSTVRLRGYEEVTSWFHVCGTYNSQNNGECKLYINGKCEATKFAHSSKQKQMDIASQYELQIGGIRVHDAHSHFYGVIFDVQLYDVCLSNDEINGLRYGVYSDKLVLASQDMVHWNGEAVMEVNEETMMQVSEFNVDERMDRIYQATPNRYQYSIWYRLQTQQSLQWITFYVRARNDCHICLGSDTMHNGTHYEIVLGGWANTQSVIRSRNQGAAHCTYRARWKWHNGVQFVPFWIAWSDGVLRVGQGNSVRHKEFMQMKMLPSIEMKYMSVCTGWGSSGDWLLCNVVKNNA